jgi:PhoPQ-activated pathogenicity-related protein
MRSRVGNTVYTASLTLVIVCGTTLSAEETELDKYVTQPDPSYRWEFVKIDQQPRLTTMVIDMTSQTWRSPQEVNQPTWRHWLIVSRPEKVTSETALLFISGGKNGSDPPDGPDKRMAELALASQSVVATLLMVPNQPLVFHGDGKKRVEDDLVAYTWVQFLKTGDPTWPARNPMVKSAVRAMDTITEALATREGGRLTVDQFVVAGGSKRGWTTWLTGAIDSRVRAIVPIVIDVLNVEESMRHHYASYGFWAPAVHDYVEQRIFEQMGTEEMARLVALVDPYHYRNRLKMPKFILNAAGDQFFLPDSSQFYFDQLQGDKYLRYVPNADHSLDGSDAVESLLAFYLTVLRGKPRPSITWSFEPDGTIRVKSQTAARSVTLWQATNPDARDFRLETLGAKYVATQLTAQADGSYAARPDPPTRGWTAYFVEMAFDIGERVPFKQTTAVRVIPDRLPFQDKDPRTAVSQ